MHCTYVDPDVYNLCHGARGRRGRGKKINTATGAKGDAAEEARARECDGILGRLGRNLNLIYRRLKSH